MNHGEHELVATGGDDHHHDAEDIIIATGLSGSLELSGNILRLSKGGAFGMLLMVLGIEGGFVERSIRVSDISAVEIENPPFLFRYVRFSYQGAPTQSGNSIRDMLAENAIIMSLIDNRAFYRIKERIEGSMSH
ncbi:hypothetical protein TI04_04100 [Achromatium sp. WMS2]|nr:hypothetical protein TI04_04100 [Achromatium sp. WMS2]